MWWRRLWVAKVEVNYYEKARKSYVGGYVEVEYIMDEAEAGPLDRPWAGFLNSRDAAKMPRFNTTYMPSTCRAVRRRGSHKMGIHHLEFFKGSNLFIFFE